MRERPASSFLLKLLPMVFGVSQIQSACGYAPPPLPSHAQTAETMGKGGVALSAEVGRATVASWWDASNIVDVEQSSGVIGAGRARFGISPNVDIGLAGGYGPRQTFLLGPELKWRFSRVAPTGKKSMPGFQAAWVTGAGVGSSLMRWDPTLCDDGSANICMENESDGEVGPRRTYVAPYTGLLVSAGTETTQLYTGVRFGMSEVLGNRLTDLTLYPSLGFGAQLRLSRFMAVFAETDFGGALTTTEFGDSGVFTYFGGGFTVSFGGKLRHVKSDSSEPRELFVE